MKNQKKSYVLISVLVIMMVMLAIAYILADVLFSEMAIARNQKAATTSFHLAEAGVQEAVWRLQYEPTARDKFLNTVDGETVFSHDPALLSGGSYNVNITNTAKGAAKIISTGFFAFGIKTAQRKILVNVTQATTPPPYDYDAAIFTGGSTGEEDITVTAAELNITNGGGLLSSRDIWHTISTVNVSKDIFANRNIWLNLSTVTATGDILAHGNIRNTGSTVTANSVQSNVPERTLAMPSIDVTSDCLVNINSYKCLAQGQNQYFTASDFSKKLKDAGSLTFDGIVYVAGNVNIDWWRSLTVNGVLVTEGSVDVGGPVRKGTLTINHVEGQPSGVITLSKFTGWAYSVINITGLVYVGDRFSFDPWFNLDPNTKDINIEGGILSRHFEGRGLRTINIEFNKDLINEVLKPDPPETPIIQFQHWEEEY